MAEKRETAEQLRQRILFAMQADIGISERMATPFVDSVMRCFAGERAYFPVEARKYPLKEISDLLERGMTPDQVCRRFAVSRRQLNRIFAGGLPRKKATR